MKNQDKGLRKFYSYHKMKQVFATAPPRLPSTEPHLLPPTLFSGKSDKNFYTRL